MADTYISTRCKKILYMIISANGYVPLQNICEEFRLSKRSVYYELCKINDWLTSQGIPETEVVRGKGISFSDDIKKRIENAMESGKSEGNYIFSPMERIYFIICYIIYSRAAVSVDTLSQYMQVSRNTIFNDMRVVVKQLQDYDLHLEYESKNGYLIKGDCVRIRALFILYFNMLRPLYETGSLGALNNDQTNLNLHKLQQIEEKLETSYVDGTLLSIALLIPRMEENNSELYFTALKKDEIENRKEYELVKEYFPKLEEKERIYLCLHLLGARVSVTTVDVFDNYSAQSNYEMAKALVAEFEKVACVTFDDKEGLIRALYSHLNTSMYRFQYGIQVGNPMYDDIVREYPEIFDLTKIVCHYLEQQIGLPIGDGEVAYLTLHFGAHLRKGLKEHDKVRVLIVCSNGMSAGNMIKHELLKMLPGIEIVGVASSKEAVNAHKVCDVVVTTLKINCLVPTIMVHPILTDYDRKVILNSNVFKGLSERVDIEELFGRLKNFVPKENQEAMKKELVDFFEKRAPENVAFFDRKKKGLSDMLNGENVSKMKGIFKWEEALKIAGEPLIRTGCVEERYLEEIINQTKYYGPYMFITKDVVLAHAKPEDGVKEMGITLYTFEEGVEFTNNHCAKIIMVLAAKDQEKHLRILKDIMTIFSGENNAQKIVDLEDEKQILEFIKQKIT